MRAVLSTIALASRLLLSCHRTTQLSRHGQLLKASQTPTSLSLSSMIPALQTLLDVLLGIIPVPGLSAAFNILKLIVCAVQQASKSKQRLAVLAQSAAQLLQTLNKEFSASRLVQSACRESLRELNGCDYNCSNKFTVLLIFAPAYLPTFRPSSSRKMHVLSSMHCSHKMPGWRE